MLTLRGVERWVPPPESFHLFSLSFIPVPLQGRPLRPYPPPGPSFTVLWKGLGGQRRLSTPLIRKACGLAVSCSFPQKKTMVMMIMAKGPQSRGLRAPVFYHTYAFIMQAQQDTKRQSLEGVADQEKPKQEEGAMGKDQEVFGCGRRQGTPTSNSSFWMSVCKVHQETSQKNVTWCCSLCLLTGEPSKWK